MRWLLSRLSSKARNIGAWHERDLDPPHQHRYPFVSRILKGGYQHTIYSASEFAIQRINADPDFQEGSFAQLCRLTK